MKPGRWCPFVLAVRATATALVLLGGLHGGPVGWAMAAWAALSLARVPRRRLSVELAVLMGLLAWLDRSPYLAAGALVSLAAVLLAPESRTFRLNGIDRYFLAQEYEHTPMTCHWVLELERALDRAVLERAVGLFMERLPIARSFVREALLGSERFVARRAWTAPPVLFSDEPLERDDFALYRRPLDLASEPPFRVLHEARPSGTAVLVLSFHHSIADGVGGMLLLQALIDIYNEAHGQPPAPEVPPPLPDGITFRQVVRHRGRRWLVAQIRRHVRPMGKVGLRHATLTDVVTGTPAHVRHVLSPLSPEIWKRLKGVAGSLGVSRNDLLVTASLRAADAHRRANGREDLPFHLMLPTNLRAALEMEPSLQNFIGLVHTRLEPAEIRGDDAVRTVRGKIQLGRHLEDSVETPVNLGVLSLLLPPWLMRAGLRRLDHDLSSSFYSYVFTNAQALRAIPPLAGSAIKYVAVRIPLTRRPDFGITVVPVGDSVGLGVMYLHPLIADDSAHSFVARFLAEIERLAAGDDAGAITAR